VHQGSASPFFEPDTDGAVATTTVQTPGYATRRAVPVDALRGRIRRYNGGLDPEGETFGSALILLAACEYGQNVDVLARRTGLPRAFVARCARRLIDNGVWVGGRTVAEWAPDNPASGSFWNDAAVAEGKMCRRTRSEGSLEWAPAGFWNKSFHFLDPDAESRPGNLYFDSAPPAPEQLDSEEDEAEDMSGAEPERPADTAEAPAIVPAADSEDALETAAAAPVPDDEPRPVSDPDNVPPLHHVFRDAVWLG